MPRKLTKFGTLAVGDTFWWASVKWEKRENAEGVRVRKQAGRPHSFIFDDGDYVKI